MPFLFDVSALYGSGVLIGLVLTAACIVLVAEWRLALFALALQYVLLGLLLISLVQPAVAAVRIIAGAVAATILYVTMRQRLDESCRVDLKAGTAGESVPRVFIVGFAFRLCALALVAVSMIGFASSMTFFGLPAYILFSSMWLMAIGVLIAMLSRDVLRLGLGILVFTGGFSIVDTAIEGSLFLYGLLNVADLLIALVIAHLARLPSSPGVSRRRGDLP